MKGQGKKGAEAKGVNPLSKITAGMLSVVHYHIPLMILMKILHAVSLQSGSRWQVLQGNFSRCKAESVKASIPFTGTSSHMTSRSHQFFEREACVLSVKQLEEALEVKTSTDKEEMA